MITAERRMPNTNLEGEGVARQGLEDVFVAALHVDHVPGARRHVAVRVRRRRPAKLLQQLSFRSFPPSRRHTICRAMARNFTRVVLQNFDYPLNNGMESLT